MYKELKFRTDARTKIIEGVNIVADAVASTLGPRGQNVIFEETSYPTITKDGVTVAQQIFLEDKFQNMGVMIAKEAAENTNVSSGDGPQDLNSKILTPKGFVKMGKIKTGDKICGTNGTTQTVLGVFPKGAKELCKVKFGDGRVVKCCLDHLWTIHTSNGIKKTITTNEMLKTGLFKKRLSGDVIYNYYVEISKPEFEEKELPLDPYLVGLLLGDGSLSGTGSVELTIGTAKEHVINKIKLPAGLSLHVTFIEKKNSFRIKINGKTEKGETIASLLTSIGLYKTKSNTKFIPKDDLYAKIGRAHV